MEQTVITFPSVAHAFRAEKLLGQRGINVRLIPVPRALSGCCEGLAAVIADEQATAAVELLAAAGVAMLYKGIKVKMD